MPGAPAKRTIRLRNVSDVTATISSSHQHTLAQPRCTLSQERWVLAAHAVADVALSVALQSLQDCVAEQFDFSVVGGNRLLLQCNAAADTPKVGPAACRACVVLSHDMHCLPLIPV